MHPSHPTPSSAPRPTLGPGQASPPASTRTRGRTLRPDRTRGLGAAARSEPAIRRPPTGPAYPATDATRPTQGQASERPSTRTRGRTTPWVLGLLLVAAAAPAAADDELAAGQRAVREGRWGDAVAVLSPLCPQLAEDAASQARCFFYLGVGWQQLAAAAGSEEAEGGQSGERLSSAGKQELAGALDDERRALRRRAVDSYQRALELDPPAAPAHHNLAKLHAELGDAERAAHHFELALQHADGRRRPAYLESYGDFLAARGDRRGATSRYRQAVLLAPRSSSAHDKLMAVYRRDPEGLVAYLRRLVDGGQVLRARRTALDFLAPAQPATDPDFESPLGPAQRRQLLTVVAAALSGEVYDRRAFPDGDVAARLQWIADHDRTLGDGAREILRMHQRASWRPEDYRWWAARGAGNETGGAEPRDAFRRLVRAMGRWYQRHGEGGVAEKCYRLADELVAEESDPQAARELADLYLERGERDKLLELVGRYESRLQEAAGGRRASETLLAYRLTTGRMLDHLGQRGDGTSPASAIYQLERGFQLASRLDAEDAARLGARYVNLRPPRFPPALVERLAEGYRAAGRLEQANEVRLAAVESYQQNRHLRAAQEVLRATDAATLTTAQQARLADLAPALDDATLDLLYQGGGSYLQSGDVLRAAQTWEHPFFPDQADDDLSLALAYGVLGDFRRALDYAGKVLRRDPDNPSALLLRYDALRAMGDDEAAAEALIRLKRLPPGKLAADPGGVDRLRSLPPPELQPAGPPPADLERLLAAGQRGLAAGELERAKDFLQRALELAPDDPRVHLRLGLVLWKSGEQTEARRHLEIVLELAPGSDEAATARQLLESGG